mgnify:CR=1 FL=1
MKMDKIWLSALILALAVSFAAPLMAQEEACKADVEKLCKDVEPGDGRLVKCLKEHEAELSAPCKAAGEEMRDGREAMKEACKADFDAFCKGIEPREGRLIKCMKENEAKVSEKCRSVMAKGREKIMKKNPCAAEEEKYCKDATGKERKACMMKHEKEFSETCKAHIAKLKEKVMKNNPCAADMEKFCKDVERGGGRVMKCLKEHEAELSEACKAGAEKMKEGRKEGGKEGNKEGKRGKKGGRGGPKGPPPESAPEGD